MNINLAVKHEETAMPKDKKPLADIINGWLNEEKKVKTKGSTVKRHPSLDYVNTWRQNRIILLIQRTTCRCGSIYEAPNAHMMLEYIDTAHPSDRMVRANPPILIPNNLPRGVSYFDLKCDACRNCYGTFEDFGASTDQLSFRFTFQEDTPCQ